MYDNESSIILV